MRRSTYAVIVFLCSVIPVAAAAAARADTSFADAPSAPIALDVPMPLGDPGEVTPPDVPRPTVYCCDLSAAVHCSATTRESCVGGFTSPSLSACKAMCPPH